MAVKVENLDQLNQAFEKKTPLEIVTWAVETFSPSIAMTSSFGPESSVLLHLVSRVNPEIPVLFLETGYHFPETLAYRDQLAGLFGLKNIRELKADPEKKARVVAEYGGVPYEKNPDLCCQINKVEPLEPVIKEYAAWMSGIRRHQTDFRKSIQIIEEYEGGRFKVSPLVNLTSRDAWWYMKEHKIPQHPLYEKGYFSIGCWPCTKPVQAGDDERSGRWAGKSKKECGIHTFLKEVKPDQPVEEKEAPSKDMGDGL